MFFLASRLALLSSCSCPESSSFRACKTIVNQQQATSLVGMQMRSRVLSRTPSRIGVPTWLMRCKDQFTVRSNDFRMAPSASPALTCGMSPHCKPLGRSASSEHLCAPPHGSGAGPFAGGKPRRPPPDGPAYRGVQRLAATRGQLPPGWHDVTTYLPPLRVPGDLWGAVNVSWTAISSVLSPGKCHESQLSSRTVLRRVRCAM